MCRLKGTDMCLRVWCMFIHWGRAVPEFLAPAAGCKSHGPAGTCLSGNRKIAFLR